MPCMHATPPVVLRLRPCTCRDWVYAHELGPCLAFGRFKAEKFEGRDVLGEVVAMSAE